MHNSIGVQLFDFFVFFVAGSVSSFLFDTLRALDFFKKQSAVSLFFKDMLYWLAVTVSIFAVCLKYTDGEIRFYMIFGIFSGVCIYFNTVSKYVFKILRLFFTVVKRVLYYAFVFPFALILRLLNKPFFVAVSFSKRGFSSMGKKISFKFKKYRKFKR